MQRAQQLLSGSGARIPSISAVGRVDFARLRTEHVGCGCPTPGTGASRRGERPSRKKPSARQAPHLCKAPLSKFHHLLNEGRHTMSARPASLTRRKLLKKAAAAAGTALLAPCIAPASALGMG
ncbi:MAG: twin-arginine translocation signal domain-containing protein, partial [Planctomycetes bacterium]|nr:twin-arginine translocation signal domain-containing protein [Planctomycetota bacterium]